MPNIYHIALSPLTAETATGRSGELLLQAQAKLGFIPNMYKSMALNPGLLETYLQGYEQFRMDPAFTPVEQEVVFLTISRINHCTYCVAAHSFVADAMSKVPIAVTNAIRDGQSIPDGKLAALSLFTRIMVSTAGRPTHDDVTAFFSAGYEDRHILSILLAIAVKTLSNYSNHLNRPQLDPAFAGRAWNG